MSFSPFEQFQIFFFYQSNFFIFTNVIFFLIIVFSLIFYFLSFFFFSRNLFSKNIFDSFFESLYTFTYTTVFNQLGVRGSRYIPFFQFVFFFLIVSNLVGLIPYSVALTSHISLVLSLSFLIFLGIQIVAFTINGLEFFKLFLPSGTPLPLIPFIVLIELISYIFRVVSLSIRIIANIVSGHILLKLLSTFSANIFLKGGNLFFASLIPLVIVVLLSGLEMGIALLQAYVYVILCCIYMKDVYTVNAH